MTLSKSWDDLKLIISNRELNLQYEHIESGTQEERYFLYAIESPVVYTCMVNNGDDDFNDFVNNYKSNSNLPIADKSIIIEDRSGTQRIAQVVGIPFNVSPGDNEKIISYPYNIRIADINLVAKNDGDKADCLIGEDTVVATLSSAVSIGATTYNLTSTDHIKKGYYFRLGSDTKYYRVNAVDYNQNTVTSDAAAEDHNSGEDWKQTIKMGENIKMDAGHRYPLGDGIVGASLIPANTEIKIIYNYTGTGTTEVYPVMEIIY